jgi:Na+/phosphate symporter
MKIDLYKGVKVNPEVKGHFDGFLLSLFDGFEAVLRKRRKATYLVHLFEERLTKNEQRIVLQIFDSIIAQILSTLDKKSKKSIHASNSQEAPLPSEIDRLIKTFQAVSSSATTTHQSSFPKTVRAAENTVDKGEEISQIVRANVLGIFRKEYENGKK